MVSVSVIIPASNSGQLLARCLQALKQSTVAPLEIIVVDDSSTDNTGEIAAGFTDKVLCTARRSGPASARNLGAKEARGNVFFFVDSDVCVKPGTLLQIIQSFEADPELDAIMGSYDTTPDSKDFLSQYRNLMHAYVHQTGITQASTFWTGCGAIRHDVFRLHSGFSETYNRPAIEDIELGYRLKLAGCKLVLDRSIEVTHLKRWTFWNLIKTDILERGIPWTELILRDEFMPNDLNLQLSQRVSVALVFVLVAVSGALAIMSGAYLLIPLFAIVFLMLASWWSEAGDGRRPRLATAMLIALVAIIALVAYFHKMYGLIPPLVISPVLLLSRHRYNHFEMTPNWRRWLAELYIGGSIGVALFYLPAHRLLLGCFILLAVLGLLNSQFYIFLAGRRGLLFMLAAIPFHLLYHFYNGLSFLIGLARHSWSTVRTDRVRVRRL